MDDYTRYTWVFFLVDKSDVFATFKSFIKGIHNEFETTIKRVSVAPGFKDKIRYTLYVSPGSQISHIATNKGNIKRQYLLHNVLVKGNNLRVWTVES